MVIFAAEINVVYPVSDEMEIAKCGLRAGRALYGFIALRSMAGGDLGNYTYLSSLPAAALN
jgi:hypothetical protein